MVDALAPNRSDQPFGEAVLPRRAWGDGLVADAHGAQSVRDGSAVDAIPITDQVARRLSPRECFGEPDQNARRMADVFARSNGCTILNRLTADIRDNIFVEPDYYIVDARRIVG